VYGYETVAEREVHHRSGLSWDNRPANLRPETDSDHMSIENAKRPEKLSEWGKMGAEAANK